MSEQIDIVVDPGAVAPPLPEPIRRICCELAQRLRRDRPSLCVALMSAHSAEFATQDPPPPPRAAFIQEPFTPQELAEVVRRLVDSATAGLA